MSKADLTKQPAQVQAMFDTVARGYDRTNTVLAAGNDLIWRMHVARAVDPRPGQRILDVAAGTGASSVALARSGAEVVAADFSSGMIEAGRARHAAIPNLRFVTADAMDLPFDDGEFDAVTISFGLRNVVDPRTALAEFFRVTRPGGRVVVCEFSHPPRPTVRAAYGVYQRYVMPTVARIVSSNSDAYGYLSDSIHHWPDQATISTWLRGAGYTRVAYRNLTQGIVALHRGTVPDGPPRTERDTT